MRNMKPKRTIIINESQRRAIFEAMSHLDESTNKGKYRDAAKAVIKELLGSNCDYDGIEQEFFSEFFNDGHGVHATVRRLEKIMIKIAIENGFNKGVSVDDNEKLYNLKQLCQFICNADGDTRNKLNLSELKDTETYDTLFGNKTLMAEYNRKNNSENTQDNDSSDDEQKINPNYEIIRVDNWETLNKIATKSGTPEEYNKALCYAENSEIFYGPRFKGDKRTVYLILRKGYENIGNESVNMAKAPYDNYGNSLIVLFIDARGNIANSNTRWNHYNEDNCPNGLSTDFNYTKGMICRLLNISNFDSVFPYVDEYKETFEELEKQIKEVNDIKDYKKIFDIVRKHDNKYLSVNYKKWWNVIDLEKKEFLWRKPLSGWFDCITDYYYRKYNIFSVFYDQKHDYLKLDGTLLVGDDKPYIIYNGDFNKYGFMKIRSKESSQLNLMNLDGQILYEPNNHEMWFNFIDDFDSRLKKMARVGRYPDGSNFIDLNGNIVFDEWFYHFDTSFIGNDDVQSLYIVRKEVQTYNLIDIKKRKYVFDEWVDDIEKYSYKTLVITKNVNGEKRMNFMDVATRKFLLPKTEFTPDGWAEKLEFYLSDKFKVMSNGKCNIFSLKTNKYFFKEWYNRFTFNEKLCFIVVNDKGANYTDINGNVLLDKWYKEIDHFDWGFAKVTDENNKVNYLNLNGQFISPVWFDNGSQIHRNGDLIYTVVELNGEPYFIDTNLNFYDYHTYKKIESPIAQYNQMTNESVIRKNGRVIRITQEQLDRVIAEKAEKQMSLL